MSVGNPAAKRQLPFGSLLPILKKRSLDHNDLDNFRPVYDLSLVAKILEKLVLSQVS